MVGVTAIYYSVVSLAKFERGAIKIGELLTLIVFVFLLLILKDFKCDNHHNYEAKAVLAPYEFTCQL